MRDDVERALDEAPLADDELRVLATIRGSAQHKALSVAFTRLRNGSSPHLLDPRVDFDMTQYHRGRLSMLADIVLLLESEAPRRYEEARNRKQQEPPA